jgi:hypothetical protein
MVEAKGTRRVDAANRATSASLRTHERCANPHTRARMLIFCAGAWAAEEAKQEPMTNLEKNIFIVAAGTLTTRRACYLRGMANVMDDEKNRQVLALGRLG